LPIFRQHIEYIRFRIFCLCLFGQLAAQGNTKGSEVFLDQIGVANAGLSPIRTSL
tara:strand:- start:5047 stop:5211 length:165 start_codon:yes stop_codon:yes gene_type:complete